MCTYIRVHVTCTCNVVTTDKNCAVTVQTEMDTLGIHLVRKNNYIIESTAGADASVEAPKLYSNEATVLVLVLVDHY